MKIKKVEKVEREVVYDYICNKCGESCSLEPGYGFGGLLEGYVAGTYGSTHLEDFTSYSFCLCEKCLVELFDTFKIPVDKEFEGV